MFHEQFFFSYNVCSNLTMNRNQMLLRILKIFIDRACTQEDAIHAKYCSISNRLIIKIVLS